LSIRIANGKDKENRCLGFTNEVDSLQSRRIIRGAMENWYKVTLPYGKGYALVNQLQLDFEIAWEAHGSPRDAALFTNHDSDHEYEFIYFSPAAATITHSILRKFEGRACDPPVRSGTMLLVGHPDASESLLPE
jgi:hypothetical protein